MCFWRCRECWRGVGGAYDVGVDPKNARKVSCRAILDEMSLDGDERASRATSLPKSSLASRRKGLIRRFRFAAPAHTPARSQDPSLPVPLSLRLLRDSQFTNVSLDNSFTCSQATFTSLYTSSLVSILPLSATASEIANEISETS